MSKFYYGEKSKANIRELHPKLQHILAELIELMDVSVITGYRGREEQNAKYEQGLSNVKYPDSKHNTYPAHAVDIHPYPYDPEDRERFTYMAGLALGIAHMQGIKVRWGGDWDQDGEVKDNKFDDLFHLELDDSED